MPRFVVETLVAADGSGERSSHEWRVRSAAGELRRSGARVCFERAIAAPEDGTCVILIRAATEHEAALVAERAGLAPFRIAEASSWSHRPGADAEYREGED